jgi:hypothetical protein
MFSAEHRESAARGPQNPRGGAASQATTNAALLLAI